MLQNGAKGKTKEKVQAAKAGPVGTTKESPAKKRKAPAADAGTKKAVAAVSGKKKAKETL